MSHAIVLAGGLGTRLRSVVADRPKCMALVGDRPFLSYLLNHLERQGVTDVVLAVGFMKERVVGAFGDRYRSLRLRYSIEEAPLGTGGALRKALGMIDQYPVLALNGDTFLAIDHRAMRAAHDAAGARLTIALRRTSDARRYGRAAVEDGRVTTFAAKGVAGPGIINAGVYLLAENLLVDPRLPEQFSFEKDALESRVREWRPLGFVSDAYFIDIGTPEDYERAQHDLEHFHFELR